MVKLVTREDGIKSFNLGATVYDDGSVKRVKLDKKANKVPGYSGHLTGVKAENLFGQTFFKSFKKSLRFKVKRDLTAQERWKTHYLQTHSASRLAKKMEGRNALPCDKDFQDYSAYMNTDVKTSGLVRKIQPMKMNKGILVDTHD